MAYQLKYSRYGEFAILIEWPAKIHTSILKNSLLFKKAITSFYIKKKVEVVSSYNSLLIIYPNAIDKFNSEVSNLKHLYFKGFVTEVKNTTTWEIPVCYDADFGTDIEAFSVEKKMSKTEIIKLHSTAIYTIYFTGFLPGFLYLGGLHSRLFLDRKKTPNLKVKKGAVAIGGNQTGIYPNDSPGGWHIIGNSPIDFFNVNTNPPSLFKSGDQLKFTPIDASSYLEIKQQILKSEYHLKSFITHD